MRRLADTQADILVAAADTVRPGGVLVYSVCTDTDEEGPAQVARLLERRDDFALDAPLAALEGTGVLDAAGQLRTRPDLHGTDGFFAARLRRKE